MNFNKKMLFAALAVICLTALVNDARSSNPVAELVTFPFRTAASLTRKVVLPIVEFPINLVYGVAQK